MFTLQEYVFFCRIDAGATFVCRLDAYLRVRGVDYRCCDA